jgi:hypothetical protein
MATETEIYGTCKCLDKSINNKEQNSFRKNPTDEILFQIRRNQTNHFEVKTCFHNKKKISKLILNIFPILVKIRMGFINYSY